MLFLPNGLESLASKIKSLFAGKPGGGPEGEKAAAE
jgi:hypothetical protein